MLLSPIVSNRENSDNMSVARAKTPVRLLLHNIYLCVCVCILYGCGEFRL